MRRRICREPAPQPVPVDVYLDRPLAGEELEALATRLKKTCGAGGGEAAVGADPVEFRLRHLRDERARTVIEAVARNSTWRAGGVSPLILVMIADGSL